MKERVARARERRFSGPENGKNAHVPMGVMAGFFLLSCRARPAWELD